MTTNQPSDNRSSVEQPDAAVATQFSSLTPVHWGTLGLAAITGVIHLYLYTTENWLPFLLAGAGFFGAIGLFFALKNYRRYLYLGAIPYTAAQIGGYLLLPMGPLWLAVIDKVVQVAFIGAVVYLYTTERRQRRERNTVAERRVRNTAAKRRERNTAADDLSREG